LKKKGEKGGFMADNLKTDKRNLADIGLGGNDRELMNKKGLSVEDIKGVLTDETMGSPAARADIFKTLAVIVFGILLVATGVFIAVTTYYTIFGILAGAVMAIVGIALPIYGLRSKSSD
jgi:hypothetical protein